MTVLTALAVRARIEGLRASIASHVPERHIALHSEGRVRLVRIGTRTQVMAAAFTTIVAGWLSFASINMVATSGDMATMQAKDAELGRMADQVEMMKANVAGLRGSVATTAERLEKRQAFLASLLSGKGDLRQLAALVPHSDDAGSAVSDARARFMLAPFLRLERDQLAFVDRATTAAQARYRDTQALLARLGLDSARFVGQSMLGVGGPLEPVDGASSPLREAEPKFKDLFLSWKKVEQLENSMAAIPAAAPVTDYQYSSGFGVRFDPFNGNAAMHTGVDMTGHQGEEIHATADGVVSRAAWFGGYGNCVDLEHGKGIATRYGHMSRILVQPGQTIHKGDVVGLMGSTGRSTGTHLHYEVRIDGRAVNPMPFLQSAPVLAAIQDRSDQRGQGNTALASN